MLAIALPHVQAWNAWFAWFGNSPDGYRPLRDKIDEACRQAGRDPAEVERTLALFVAFPGAAGRSQGDREEAEAEPISGEPQVLASRLREFAEEGVAHVQLVLDPITADTIRALGPTLERLDG
jgi:alkanesulfonate monooxygenase SsuD/methylene tetrahydromethanopterin reductase-like flavin-dependent oxidoreductase (luciferase family)